MSNNIELIALDKEGYELYRNDSIDTIKEAKAWAKNTLLDRGYWDRSAENTTYATEIDTIQLKVNGEVHTDWFPEFK